MSQRIERLNSLIRREVAGLLSREIEFPPGVFVTVTKADVSDDAENASVWVSVLPDERSDEMLASIQHRIGDIQTALNRRLVMKFVPKLTFRLDHAEARAERINRVLDRLDGDADRLAG